MKNYLTEFIGTFFLVLTISLCVSQGVNAAPLAIGSALMVMVYMGGHISGAHYNPAVSLAIWMRGKLTTGELIPYWVSQLLGATVAGFVAAHLAGASIPIVPGDGASTLAVLGAEFLFTFALALVVLNAATSPGTAGNSFYGLAIGFTVMVGAYSVGAISGGAFNPAVGTGLTLSHAVVGGGGMGALWFYLVGPFLGGAAAAAVFKIQHPGEEA